MRVDFYILADDAAATRDLLGCRLAEKAYKQGLKVYLHVDSEEHAARVDDLLWSFRAGSFVPHSRCRPGQDSEADSDTPVRIGRGAEPPPETNILINLSTAVPGFFRRFTRIAEIVDRHEDDRKSGRERFRFYREQGLQPHSHNVNPGQAE